MNEDLSNLFEKFNINKDSISPEMIDNIMGMLNSSTSESTSTPNSTNNIDFNTIIKMKSIFDKMNTKDDPRSNLLLSLKPYLKESRQNKLEQYIQIAKLLQILPYISGDNNVQ